MQILITHGTLARTRVLHFSRWQMAAMLISLVALLTLLSGTVYHFVFLKAAREGWPVVASKASEKCKYATGMKAMPNHCRRSQGSAAAASARVLTTTSPK